MSRIEDAIRVEGVSKRYVVGRKGRTPLGQLRKNLSSKDVVEAVKDYSFTVRRGERVGIIGPNGAGKSTLLRMVCGITEPDKGKVTTRGSLVAMVGLQAGFNKALTGRQNIDIKARLHGMSAEEIEARRDAIAEFADIGRFIDEPMTTYSKGMQARLAFAIAFSMSPDILVVDESLSGGDEAFKRKTMERLSEIREAGTTILLVSHAPAMIRQLCDRAILMDQGEKLLEGEPDEILRSHQAFLAANGAERDRFRTEWKAGGRPEFLDTGPNSDHVPDPEMLNASGQVAASVPTSSSARPKPSLPNGAQLGGIELCNTAGVPVTSIDDTETCVFRVRGRLITGVRALDLLLLIRGPAGERIAKLRSCRSGNPLGAAPFSFKLDLGLEKRLPPATYSVDLLLRGDIQGEWIALHSIVDACAFNVSGRPATGEELAVDLTTKATWSFE